MQVDQVEERSVDERLDRDAWLAEQHESDENEERSSKEEHNIVV